MITLKEVTFSYKKKCPIFTDLALSLTGGHIYGLLGKNGSGKTTLMKIMSGLRFAQTGTVAILGEAAQWRLPQTLQNCYYLPEELETPPFSVRDYVTAYANFYPNFSRDDLNNYLQQFEIFDQTQKISAMSHGQKKKFFIAFALATHTAILLMDEPTNGLDIPSKSMFRKVMAMAADDQRLFIISTHQVRDLHSLIDAIILLDGGEILLNEPVEVITDKLLFQVVDNLDDTAQPLYSEDTLRGIFTVSENIHHEDSKLDIELFFNAALANRNKIKQLFNNF